MNPTQLREFIIRPTLEHLDPEIPYSIEAEDLLLGTACAESQCGHYIKQINGPALGIWQMETDTEEDNWKNFLRYRESLFDLVIALYPENEKPEPLIMSSAYACAQARIKYYRDDQPLPKRLSPDFADINYLLSLGHYWKRVYNTDLGKGTVEGFIKKVEKYGDFN